MKYTPFVAMAALSMALPAQAAVMSSSFVNLAGSSWAVELAVINAGAPAEVSGFTVYFSEAAYADLVLAASPVSWDSLVIQPDTGLASAGYLDSFMLDRSQPLMPGASQAGFTVQFTYSGAGAPPALPFEIVDESYNVLFAGQTTPAAPVPEPATYLLTALGLGLVGAAARRRRTAA